MNISTVMGEYDLRIEQWIPVVYREGDSQNMGSKIKKLSLIQVFEDAHLIERIQAENLLETVALCRFLMAIFIDMLNADHDEETWFRIWNQGKFDPILINNYFFTEPNCGSFNLGHPDKPFYQHPMPLDGVKPSKLSRLFAHKATGNNATLFDHNFEMNEPPINADKVAIALICTQAFSSGGGVSKPFNFSHAPLMGKTFFFIHYETLFGFIMLNMPPDDRVRHINETFLYSQKQLPPAWRQVLPEIHFRRPAYGILDILTWQSKRVKLIFDNGDCERNLIRAIYYSQGFKDEPEITSDPHLAYFLTNDNTLRSLSITHDRSTWRDFDYLMITRKSKEMPGGPLTFNFLKRNLQRIGFKKFSSIPIWIVFSDTDQAKINIVGEQFIQLYPDLIDNRIAITILISAKEIVKKQRDILSRAIRETARAVLAPIVPGSNEPGKPDNKQVIALSLSLGWETSFLDRFNAAYPDFVSELAMIFHNQDNTDHDETQSRLEKLILDWQDKVYRYAKQTFYAVNEPYIKDTRKIRAFIWGSKFLFKAKLR
ncbi:MAG: type I-E CRISPR-associated protein Cse1/CasA [Bacteroidetes bacterium]|nr:type I-E CRISPR-associated protein Cse1/CasA [Bacteroidota bacterium]